MRGIVEKHIDAVTKIPPLSNPIRGISKFSKLYLIRKYNDLTIFVTKKRKDDWK